MPLTTTLLSVRCSIHQGKKAVSYICYTQIAVQPHLSPFVVKPAAKRARAMLPTSLPLQRHPAKGFQTHISTAPSFRQMNIQQVCPFVLARHFCLPLLTRSPTHSLDRYHPIATALVLPTLINKVLILACVLKLKDILWRLSTHPSLASNDQAFGDPRFQNGSLTSNNSHHTMLANPKDWYRHRNHPAHHIGRL